MRVSSPFPPIHLDTIHTHLCPYLNVYDLCRLMRVSRVFLECFMVDRAFQHIRDCICRRIPPLVSIFEKYAWECREKKRANLKRRKLDNRTWAIPLKGIRYTIKRHLFPLTNAEGLIVASKNKNKDIATTLIRGALQWGICSHYAKCYEGGETNYRIFGGDSVYFICQFLFDKGSITISGQKGPYLTSCYKTNHYGSTRWSCLWGLPGDLHTPTHIFERCTQLFMGLPITTQVQGMPLRHLVGEDI